MKSITVYNLTLQFDGDDDLHMADIDQARRIVDLVNENLQNAHWSSGAQILTVGNEIKEVESANMDKAEKTAKLNALVKDIRAGKQIEARRYFADNPNKYPFAGNYFGLKKNAVEFVEELYAAGATQVRVDGLLCEDHRIKAQGGPYADTFIVTIPTGALKSVNEVIDGASPDEKSRNGKQTRLWWD